MFNKNIFCIINYLNLNHLQIITKIKNKTLNCDKKTSINKWKANYGSCMIRKNDIFTNKNLKNKDM